MPAHTRRRTLITGATSGLGQAAARLLAARGHELLLVGRNPAKTAAVCAEIRAHGGAPAVHALLCDFSDPRQIAALVRRVREEFRCVDVLINNAGVFCPRYTETAEGFETTLAINHLGYFRLAGLLSDCMSAGGRIVNVSSRAHFIGRINFENINLRGAYGYYRAYSQSKLANLLHTFELAARAAKRKVAVNVLHPGVVATNIWPEHRVLFRGLWAMLKPWMSTPEEGASTMVYLADDQAVEGVTGEYFEHCLVVAPARRARDPLAARRLWEWSEQASGVAGWCA